MSRVVAGIASLVAAATFAAAGLAAPASAASPDLVISQVYGGGGNGGSTLKNDFVELFNRGHSPVAMSDFEVRYFSAASGGQGGNAVELTGTLQPGQYYLIQMAAGGGGTADLPTPDAIGDSSMGAAAGRVDLLAGTTVYDRLGYGTGAGQQSETSPTGNISGAVNAAKRNENGCQDTDNNSANFTVNTPAVPRNSASSSSPCGPAGLPAVTCGPRISVAAGETATRQITASDPDGEVELISIAAITPDPPGDTITIGATMPETIAGTPASAIVTVDNTTPAGDYDVTVAAENEPGTPGTCTLRLSVLTVTPIHAIQGSTNPNPNNSAGYVSPFVDQTKTIVGVVTGIDDENGASTTNPSPGFPDDRGIFVQEEEADYDADLASSEGIFVGQVTDPTAYAIGDKVQVTGLVVEKFGFTQMNVKASQQPLVLDTIPVPAATIIDEATAESQATLAAEIPNNCAFPAGICREGRRAYYERLEGMLVELPVGVANSGGTNGFAELMVTPGDELDPVLVADDPAGTTDPGIRSLLGAINDAGSGNPSNPLKDQTSTTTVNADHQDRVENLRGPLTFNFGLYKVVPQEGAMPTIVDGPTEYPFARVPDQPDGTLRVTFFNVENFFPVGGDLDGELVTTEEYEQKRDRIADAIDRLLKRPDVVGLEEVGGLSDLQTGLASLQDLAAQLTGYTAYLERGRDNRFIDVGYLIKDGVTATNVRQLGADASDPGSDCSDEPPAVFDRPPLAVDIEKGGLEATVLVNHWASKAAPDECRIAQAVAVKEEVAALETAGREVIVGGDLNAFEFESPLIELTSGGETTLENQILDVPEDQRFSFHFGGRLQVLDHILVTEGLQPSVTDIRFSHFDNEYFDRTLEAEAAGLCDPPADDACTDGHKVSDHDPPLLTLRLPTAPEISCGDPLATQSGIVATRDVTASDADGDATVTNIAIDSTTPTPADGTITAPFTAATGGNPAKATVTVSNRVPVGTYEVVLTATDDTGRTDTCTLTVGVTASRIGDVQGTGASTPVPSGGVRTVVGMVVGIDNEGPNERDRGIFIQDTTADTAGAASSDAIFVSELPAANPPSSFTLGHIWQVRGTVREQFGLTSIELDLGVGTPPLGTLAFISAGTLPAPVDISTASADGQTFTGTTGSYYETLESMRVRIPTAVTTAGGTNKFQELFVSPGSTLGDPVMRTDTDEKSVIGIDEDAGEDNPPNPLRDPTESTTVVKGDQFDTVSEIVGPMNFAFNTYRVMPQPGTAPTVADTGVAFPYTGVPNQPVNTLRVTFFNVENYFPVGGDLDGGTVTQAEYDTKRGRIVNAINVLLKRPDVVGVEEVVDLTILQALATDLGGYTAYLEEGNDNRGIDVGFLIRDGVTVNSVTQLGKNATESLPISCSDIAGNLYDRPPLEAVVTKQGVKAAVIVNHFASKATGNEACRVEQAKFVRDRVKTIELAGGEAIVGGDLNDFEEEGAPTTLQDGVTSLDNLVDVDALVPPLQRYSFSFQARLQVLDHILVTDGLRPLVRDTKFAHFDNDYFDRGTDGHKVSDHDPPIATVNLPAPPANTAAPFVPAAQRDNVVSIGDRGQWSGAGPIAFAYAWLRCDDATLPTCAPIPGATGLSYSPGLADIGKQLRLRVTANNVATAGVGVVANSAPSSAVLAGAPRAGTAPAITGVAKVASVLTANDGTLASGATPVTVTRSWLRCNALQSSACSIIAGATGTTYTPVAADVGQRIGLQVKHTNAFGSLTRKAPPSDVTTVASARGAVREDAAAPAPSTGSSVAAAPAAAAPAAAAPAAARKPAARKPSKRAAQIRRAARRRAVARAKALRAKSRKAVRNRR